MKSDNFRNRLLEYLLVPLEICPSRFSLLKYDDSADTAGDAFKFYDTVNIALATDDGCSVRKRVRRVSMRFSLVKI